MVAVVDGFSAPLTAGHFVELASKGSFDRSVVDFEDESSVVFKATGEEEEDACCRGKESSEGLADGACDACCWWC